MGFTDRKVQYLAGTSASLTFLFTGAVLSWSSPAIPKFQSKEAKVEISDSETSWVVALLGLGALFGCYVGQVLSDRVGRRRTIFSGAISALLGSGIILFTKTPAVMYVGRIFIGLSTGTIAVVTMVYITEIADKEIRGQLGMLVQVMNNLGSLLVYCIGPFVSYTILNSLIFSLPIIYVLLNLWIPESPYYYLKDGKIDKAKKEFMRLKQIDDHEWADQQLDIVRVHVKESMENKSTVKELFTNMKYRRALYIVACLKVLQYFTGSIAIQSYLEIIFRKSSFISGPMASIVYGFVQLGAGVVATFLPAWFGRRPLMLVSSLGVAVSLTVVGVYFFLQDFIKLNDETLLSIKALPLVGVLLFNILYAIGLGNLPYVMQTELFPINVKIIASSTATMMSCVLNIIVTKCYQIVKDFSGLYTVFWIFAVVAYLGVICIYFFIPETKGKTLEEITDNLQHVEAEPLQKEKSLITDNLQHVEAEPLQKEKSLEMS